MNYSKLVLSFLACFCLMLSTTSAQLEVNMAKPGQQEYQQANDHKVFNSFRGMNIIEGADKDGYGNPNGSDYDLVRDDAFDGVQIAVLHLYTGESFDFVAPASALQEKGFVIKRWADQAPSPQELRNTLQESSQLWVISDRVRKLNDQHIAIIKEFFDSGKGVYIWGDNEPYYADANHLAQALFGNMNMSGNLQGDHTVGLNEGFRQQGLAPSHDITTGLEKLYEGITVATVKSDSRFTPLIYGSAGNLIAAVYEKDGKRAIIDGGFTRLFYKWDTAGTGRYIRNAAGWLVNYDQFGDLVFRY